MIVWPTHTGSASTCGHIPPPPSNSIMNGCAPDGLVGSRSRARCNFPDSSERLCAVVLPSKSSSFSGAFCVVTQMCWIFLEESELGGELDNLPHTRRTLSMTSGRRRWSFWSDLFGCPCIQPRHNAVDTSVMQRCHTDHVVLGQVHVPLCVVDIGDVIHSIATVVRTAHPQLRMLLTKTVVGFVLEVVLVWIQLQRDTVLLVPDRNRRCGII